MYERGGKATGGDGSGTYVVPPALAAVGRAIEALAAVPAPARTPAELAEDLKQLRHCVDLLEVEFARRAAAFAGSDEYERDGSISAEDWLRHQCHTAGVVAHSRARYAA
jgi:hypothetical protein